MDTLPSFCNARVLILGVGNMLFGDDGFGPAVVDHLNRHYRVPDDAYVMDTGTGVRKLLFTLALGETHPEEIVIVDAVDWGREIGRVFEIPAEALPATKVDDFSLHQVPTSNLLHDLQDLREIKVTVVACDVGIVPQRIEPGLSPAVESAVARAAGQIAERYALTPNASNGSVHAAADGFGPG